MMMQQIRQERSESELSQYLTYLVTWLSEERDYRQAEKFVFGVSGGVDSAVIAGIMAHYYPDEAMGVLMPSHSNPQDLADAICVMEHFKLPYHIVDLSATFDQLMTAVGSRYNHIGDESKDRVIRGNNSARLRMTALYTVAQVLNGIVVGTDNAVEWYTGYFTKFGDGGVDIAPLIHLDKAEVFTLAKLLNVPQKIIEKKPSAGLWDSQTDEGEMGVTYDALNRHLRGETVSADELAKIQFWHERSHHKRALPRMPKKPA